MRQRLATLMGHGDAAHSTGSGDLGKTVQPRGRTVYTNGERSAKRCVMPGCRADYNLLGLRRPWPMVTWIPNLCPTAVVLVGLKAWWI
ncbi:hypothetical protein PGT21_005529 [Puccinia graminis f. sp. tritici]|uniref:Uncharacterized protein n=1 Tax=Puccinia graminis f. sp. tritici TaxID=56615 RepID=A0A5B0NXP2_PUCGR|nr:hypothetical protein PGT21_003974 [Puccinia graminis f. sp. tritici]KAA1108239.1 hypothetical protein PGT21_005529 [Puccinia graminis f. sp. tritici]